MGIITLLKGDVSNVAKWTAKLFRGISPGRCILALCASVFLAFGLYNVHSVSGVTEGGVLGLTLFFKNLLGLSPAVSGLVLNLACYLLGWKVLGREFLVYSAVAAGGFSLGYRIFELWPPLWPELADMPFWAATIGAFFVGGGGGLSIRYGGAPSGDDALGMSVRKLTKMQLPTFYLISDLTVLLLSATYIPWQRMLFSLYTVVLSGQVVGWVTKEKKDAG